MTEYLYCVAICMGNVLLCFRHSELLSADGLYADMWHQQQVSAADDDTPANGNGAAVSDASSDVWTVLMTQSASDLLLLTYN